MVIVYIDTVRILSSRRDFVQPCALQTIWCEIITNMLHMLYDYDEFNSPWVIPLSVCSLCLLSYSMKSYGELEKLGPTYDLLKNICWKHAWISEKNCNNLRSFCRQRWLKKRVIHLIYVQDWILTTMLQINVPASSHLTSI